MKKISDILRTAKNILVQRVPVAEPIGKEITIKGNIVRYVPHLDRNIYYMRIRNKDKEVSVIFNTKENGNNCEANIFFQTFEPNVTRSGIEPIHKGDYVIIKGIPRQKVYGVDILPYCLDVNDIGNPGYAYAFHQPHILIIRDNDAPIKQPRWELI